MKKISVLITIAVLAVSIWAASPAEAVIVNWRSPMVGIVEGVQTARLNVVNVAPADIRTPPNPCMVELMFFDGEGNMLSEAGIIINDGKAAFHDLRFPADVEGRFQIRAEVRVTGEKKSCDVISTLEIFDNETMKTEIFIGITPGI